MMPLKDPKARREYHREYMRRRYREDVEFRTTHKKRTRKNSILVQAKSRKIIAEFKKSGCLLCGEKEPCCMSAHHVLPEGKDFNIGDAVGMKYGEKRLRQELAKCVCICLNCHQKVHAGIVELPA
jgi:hypothetical protein